MVEPSKVIFLIKQKILLYIGYHSIQIKYYSRVDFSARLAFGFGSLESSTSSVARCFFLEGGGGMGVLKCCALFGGTHNEAYSMLGLYWGPPYVESMLWRLLELSHNLVRGNAPSVLKNRFRVRDLT